MLFLTNCDGAGIGCVPGDRTVVGCILGIMAVMCGIHGVREVLGGILGVRAVMDGTWCQGCHLWLIFSGATNLTFKGTFHI